MANLDQQLAEYYQSQRLDDAQLRRLVEMADPQEKTDNPSKRFGRPYFISSVAAAVLVSVFIFFATGPDLTQRIAQEIAMNHSKNLDVEHRAESYQDATARMTALDFKLIESSELASLNLSLSGVRYCSIQGQIAAQIKLQDDAGHRYTLYQTRLTSKLTDTQWGQAQAGSVSIKLWQEEGLLLGLARH